MFFKDMPRVSSQELHQVIERKLLTQLAETFMRIKQKNSLKIFGALFTREEQVMLAKRIAVLYMLKSGCSMYRIVRVLKMSSSTVIRMKREFERGWYDPLVDSFGKSTRQRKEFWQRLDLLLTAGMPSRGKDRWKWLDKYFPRA